MAKMNARTCQLCGRPLSRLRGNEGDFCSKEHRNQYRLRAGMNRLQEANKVANLMRRRENPRQIGASRLICNSDGAAKVCDAPPLLSSHKKPAPAWIAFSVCGQTQMPDRAQGYRNPGPLRIAGFTYPRRPNSSRIRIAVRKQPPALPARLVSMPAKLEPAQILHLRAAWPDATPKHRLLERLPDIKIRVALGRGPAALRGADALVTVSIHRAAGTCKVRTTPREGNALRVSTAIGFRVHPAELRQHASKAAMCNALEWPGTPYSTMPGNVARPAEPKLLGVEMALPPAIYPTGPEPARPTRFSRANPLAVAAGKPVRATRPAAKFCGVGWNPADPTWAGTVPGPRSAGFSRRNGAHLYALAMQPFAIDAMHQFASLPIPVRESPVGYPKVAIHDTLAGAILSPGNLPAVAADLSDGNDESEPGGPIAAAPVEIRHEEAFDKGWGDWSGGTADWKMDAAGVRTGSLALFNPSMDMIDYDLEFLARIDRQSVIWVVRAADPSMYCRCALTAIPGGELEFSHSVLVDGVSEPAVKASARLATKPKSAITVRTRVHGQQFSVTVDGKPMDSWKDSRLPTGGIGFMGTPEDQARLYWIRLSSVGSPGKEYRK